MDDELRVAGRQNTFAFAPEPTYEDLFTLDHQARALGYSLRLVNRGRTLGEIQDTLRTVGPSAFLRQVLVAEDISPKAPPLEAARFISARLARLEPQAELLITDPYMLTKTREKDAEQYAQDAHALIAPLLSSAVMLRLVVSEANTSEAVRDALLEKLRSGNPELRVDVVESDDFHDRFWIADRARGIVMGTSLNRIGRRIFLIDALSDTDVKAVLDEVDAIVRRQE